LGKRPGLSGMNLQVSGWQAPPTHGVVLTVYH
jgi:hypothetical protein